MKYTKLIIFLIISTLILSCSEDKKYNIELKGNTMGTYYLVSLVDVPKNLSKKEIEIEIKNTLLEANKILSNWDKSSEISKLNNNKTMKPIQISNELFDVVSEANSINTKSNGYFDITLDPLIELWILMQLVKNPDPHSSVRVAII
mgnify:CR=1 FL=1